jgi:hypothetical protein
VDQVARTLVLVTANRLAGSPVDMGQPVDPTPHQDRMDRRRRHPKPIADLDRPEPLFPAQVHDLAHHRLRRAVRLTVRPGGAVIHPRRPLGQVPVRPLLRGSPRDVEALGRPGDGPALLDDQPGNLQPGTRRQSSVGMGSVGHEDLLVVERFLDSSTPHREVFTVYESHRLVTPSRPT